MRRAPGSAWHRVCFDDERMKTTPLVIATDLSETAAAAARWAAALGAALDRPVLAAHVVEVPWLEVWDGGSEVLGDLVRHTEVEALVRAWYLDATGQEPAGVDIRIDTCFRGLREVARDHDPLLMVLGAAGHGRLHQAVVGSRVHPVAAHPPCPVAVIRPEAPSPARGATLAAAVDFDEPSTRAAVYTAEFAAALGGTLDLVTVAHLPRTRTVAAVLAGREEVWRRQLVRTGGARLAALCAGPIAAAAPGLTCNVRVLEGAVAPTLVELAAAEAVTALAIGHSGHIGGTVHSLLHHGPPALLVVPAAP
jgi:nucleotide-binding universal stress UspA family protein